MKGLKRLREPSTWAGFAVLGALFGIKELESFGVPEVAAGLAALASILLPERDARIDPSPPAPPPHRDDRGFGV